MKLLSALLSVLALFSACSAVRAADEGIGWIPSWKQAVQEASKTHKPILVVAAAPQCAGVPGSW